MAAPRDQRLNITDLIAAVEVASPEQKAVLLGVLGAGAVSPGDIEGLVADEDFASERELDYVFGRLGDDWGQQALAGMIKPSHLQTAVNSVLISGPEGSWSAENAEALRTFLDFANTGKAAFVAMLQAIVSEPEAGLAILQAAAAALAGGATKAASRTALDAGGLLYIGIGDEIGGSLTAGSVLISSDDGTTKVEGADTAPASGSMADVFAGTPYALIDAATMKLLTTERGVTPAAGALEIDFAEGLSCSLTTSGSFTLSFIGLPSHLPGLLKVTGGGAHTITIDTDKVIPEDLNNELVTESGKVYLLTFLDNGTEQIITVSPAGAA